MRRENYCENYLAVYQGYLQREIDGLVAEKIWEKTGAGGGFGQRGQKLGGLLGSVFGLAGNAQG